jgi:hypothetical protein
LSDVRLFLGKRGFGKSTALHAALKSEPRVLLFDTLRERTYDDFQRIDSFPELCRFLARSPRFFHVAYSWHGDVTREEDFERVCDAVMACRSLVFAVDEVDLYCSPTYLPRGLDMAVSIGRHQGISVWCATRRPKEVHPLIRSQSSRITSFAQTEPGDLEWCRAVMGDMTEQLPKLPRYKAVEWSDDAEPIPDPLDNPQKAV